MERRDLYCYLRKGLHEMKYIRNIVVCVISV